jgi:hypothetical protein
MTADLLLLGATTSPTSDGDRKTLSLLTVKLADNLKLI